MDTLLFVAETKLSPVYCEDFIGYAFVPECGMASRKNFAAKRYAAQHFLLLGQS
jgi:hypothetical protein